MVNFRIWIPDCDSPSLFNLFISSDASICSTMAFPPLEISGHVVASVSNDFPSNSKGDAPFHCIAYGYSCADCDGLHDYLRDVSFFICYLAAPQSPLGHCQGDSLTNLMLVTAFITDSTQRSLEALSLNLELQQLLMNFVSEFRLELRYISHIVNIRSSITHLHDFLLLVLLPELIKIVFFLCANRINLLNLK